MPPVAQNSAPNGASELRALASEVDLLPAMERLLAFRDENYPASNPRYWAAVNFNLHSSKPRLHLFDRVANDRADFLCAHGKGSDPGHSGFARRFSNVDGSLCTCLDIFRTGETYQSSRNGYSLYLHGESPSNFNAFRRHIVMHGARYVTPEWVNENGRAGRSDGCPAVGPEHARDVIDALRGGSFLIHWHSQLEDSN